MCVCGFLHTRIGIHVCVRLQSPLHHHRGIVNPAPFDHACPTTHTQALTIAGVGGGLNPLCCRAASLGDKRLLLVTGGVDKFLTLYTVHGGEGRGSSSASPPEKAAVVGGFPGPLLSLDLAPAAVTVVEEAAAVRACVTYE